MATERVISSKVLGSSNPVAKKFRSIGQSIKGVGCGIIFLIIGLVLVYQSVYGVKEYSKILENLPVNTVSDVAQDATLAKLSGKAESSSATTYSYEKCNDTACITKVAQNTEPAYYVTIDKQRFEVVEHVTTETVTRDVGGSEIEEKVEKREYKEEWVSKEKKTQWAEISIDNKVKFVGSDSVRLITNLVEKEVPNVFIANLGPLNNYGQTVSPAVGTTRLVYSFMPISTSSPSVIAVGQIRNGVMSGGDPSILTTLTDADLIKTLENEENFSRIAFVVGAWILTFIGLGMIIAPILELVNWIPLFGGAAKLVAGVISFIVTSILVFGGWIVLKFWWLILLCIMLLMVVAIVLVVKSRTKTIVAETNKASK